MSKTIHVEIRVQLPNGNYAKIGRELDMPEREADAGDRIAAWLENEAENMPFNKIFDGLEG